MMKPPNATRHVPNQPLPDRAVIDRLSPDNDRGPSDDADGAVNVCPCSGCLHQRALLLRHSRAFLSTVSELLVVEIGVCVELPRPWLSALGDSKALVEEHLIHVLQTAPRRLRVEEVGDWHEARVEYGPDDVQFGTEVSDGRWGHIDDDEIGKPVGADTQGDTLVTGSEWHDFGSVHPRNG